MQSPETSTTRTSEHGRVQVMFFPGCLVVSVVLSIVVTVVLNVLLRLLD